MKKITKILLSENKFGIWFAHKWEDITFRNLSLYFFIMFVVGRIIDISTNKVFKNFLFHQILLIVASILIIYAIKKYFSQYSELSKSFERNPEIKAKFIKYQKIQKSILPFLAAIIVTAFFFSNIFLLEYIKLDVIGIYAILLAGNCVIIGVYGYMQYVFFLAFVYTVSKVNIWDYDIFSPSETKFIKDMAIISKRLIKYFLFIGLIFVTEYAILVPTDKIEIGQTININTANNLSFIITWIALFILVIIAFPVINYIQRKLIERVVLSVKSKSICQISDMMYTENIFEPNKKQRFISVLTYSAIIETIRKSKSYPIKSHLTVDAIITIASLMVHCLNLYSKLASLEWIKSFIA